MGVILNQFYRLMLWNKRDKQNYIDYNKVLQITTNLLEKDINLIYPSIKIANFIFVFHYNEYNTTELEKMLETIHSKNNLMFYLSCQPESVYENVKFLSKFVKNKELKSKLNDTFNEIENNFNNLFN